MFSVEDNFIKYAEDFDLLLELPDVEHEFSR
jgi:hypothetical protein